MTVEETEPIRFLDLDLLPPLFDRVRLLLPRFFGVLLRCFRLVMLLAFCSDRWS